MLNLDVYYKVKNGEIYAEIRGVDQRLYLFGVNWFGFEGQAHVVHGLWVRNWVELLETIRALGFNAIRIPFCTEAIKPGTTPSTISYAFNPDLQNLDSLTVLEKIIVKASELGLYIILNYHNISCIAVEPLWYIDSFTEQDYISIWVSVAQRLGKYPNVVGADLKNEPHSVSPKPSCYTDGQSATWGMGNPKTDWNLAAERIGRAVLEVAPHWLILVEGTQYTNPQSDDVLLYPDAVYWGENLRAVRDYPVNLPKDKLVYSPHVYGPDIYVLPYFEDPDIFPDNLYKIWDQNWGYVKKQLGSALVIGEFGGRYGSGDPRDVVWQQRFVDYLVENDICHFFYWALNPNSADTGGLLENDWKTPKRDKLGNLMRLVKHCSSL